MILYIDVAVFCGLVMNLLCISTAADGLKIKVKLRRLILYSLLLSSVTVAAAVIKYIMPVLIILYPLAVWGIFGKCSTAELIRRCFYLLASTLVYGALLMAFVPADKMSVTSLGARTFYLAEDLYFFLPLVAMRLLTRLIFGVLCRAKKLFPVTITCQGETVSANAFMDTGNSLADPVTGKPIIVIDEDLFGGIQDDFGRAISVRTVNGDGEKAYIYPVDRLYFEDEHKEYSHIYAMFSKKPLNSAGQYKVLLQNSL